jgi:hypothetical protein
MKTFNREKSELDYGIQVAIFNGMPIPIWKDLEIVLLRCHTVLCACVIYEVFSWRAGAM